MTVAVQQWSTPGAASSATGALRWRPVRPADSVRARVVTSPCAARPPRAPVRPRRRRLRGGASRGPGRRHGRGPAPAARRAAGRRGRLPRLGGAWQQVPVQVDERAQVDLGRVYNAAPSGVTSLTYTDPGTFAGADPDPALDADDEVALMGIDSGARAPAGSAPAGRRRRQRPGAGHHRPARQRHAAYVYLFRRSGGLDPGAGRCYVAYRFGLASGDYKTTYKLDAGPNPEDSTVTTASYTQHFSDRWVVRRDHRAAGGASGVDILDRHKALFAPGQLRPQRGHVRRRPRARSSSTRAGRCARSAATSAPTAARTRSARTSSTHRREDISDRPAGPRDPGGHGLLGLQPRRVRHDLPQRPQPGRRDDRRRARPHRRRAR